MSCNDTSSTFESNCVTLTASLSIRPCKECVLAAIAVDSLNKVVKIFSACFDSDDNWRITFARVPSDTHSSSLGMSMANDPRLSTGSVARQTCTGSITRCSKGIVVSYIQRGCSGFHTTWEPKLLEVHLMSGYDLSVNSCHCPGPELPL